jgi:hypothetical protein
MGLLPPLQEPQVLHCFMVTHLAHKFFTILSVVYNCQKNINGVITSTVMYLVLRTCSVNALDLEMFS